LFGLISLPDDFQSKKRYNAINLEKILKKPTTSQVNELAAELQKELGCSFKAAVAEAKRQLKT